MANLTVTNVDVGNVIYRDGEFNDEFLTLAGADDIASGTILARDNVTLKLVLFEKGGTTQGNGTPKAVLTYDVSAAGAGDVPIRALISGFVYKERLIIDADGDDTNVDAVVRDELRDYSIVSINKSELGILDNQ